MSRSPAPAASPRPGSRRTAPRRSAAPWLVAAAVLAIAVRMIPFRVVFSGGRITFFDGDCYMHLRNILLHIAAFPRFVTFDPYQGFPHGTVALWPPVLDWLLSALALAIGLGGATPKLAETVAALVPPLVGAATVVAVYALARNVWGHGVGLMSALLLAVMNGHVLFTLVGRPDNEMMEPLMAALLFAATLRLQAQGDEAPRSVSARAEGWWAAAAFGLLLFWRGGTLWVLLAASAMALDVVLDVVDGVPIRRHRRSAAAFLLLAALLAPLCLLNVWGRQNTFSFNVLSWFHVVLFGLMGGLLFAGGELCAWWRRKGWSRGGLVLAAGVGAGAFVLAALALPSLRTNLELGLAMLGLGKPDPWIQSINEYRPMIAPDRPIVSYSVGYFSWAIWLVPAIVLHVLWGFRKRGIDRRQAFFLVVLLATVVLTLARMRFAHMLSMTVSVAGAYALVELHRALGGERKRGSRVLPVAATAVGAALMLAPVLRDDGRLAAGTVGYSTRGQVEEALEWMRRNSPDPSASDGPAYGVLAMWDLGGEIAYVASRPAIATLYGTEAFGFRESAEFFLAEDPATGYGLLDRTRARYVVMTQMMGELTGLARALGRPEAGYAEQAGTGLGGPRVYRPGPRYFQILSTELMLTDGAGERLLGHDFPGLDRLRLVYESRQTLELRGFPRPVSSLKIFEYVPGARVRVRTSPGAEVTIEARIRTNTGRVFPFVRRAQAAPDGTALLVLPYGAASETDAVGLAEAVTVRTARGEGRLTPTDADVRSGGTLDLPGRL